MTDADDDAELASQDDEEFDWLEDASELATDEPVEDPDANDIEAAPPTADQSLRYFGADYDVDGLVRRLRAGDLIVPTFDPEGVADSDYEGFQRRFVWPKKQMDRFVESLLLGYPVPGIFLVELPNRKYLVLDGQQRLRTLRAFYDGKYGPRDQEKVFRLKYVGDSFKRLTFDSLDPSDRRLLDNTFIQATIVVPSGNDKSAVYRLFERINSSGIKLQPQEIRVALYTGPMIQLLRELNTNVDWRELFGPPHSRLKDHELILRYLALTEAATSLRQHNWDRTATQAAGGRNYTPPMNTFLNGYLDEHAGLEGVDAAEIRREFSEATRLLNGGPGRGALRITGTQINAAHTDAILVGLTLALRDGRSVSSDDCSTAIEQLKGDRAYVEAVSGSTSHRDSVKNRLSIAVDVFGSL